MKGRRNLLKSKEKRRAEVELLGRFLMLEVLAKVAFCNSPCTGGPKGEHAVEMGHKG